MTTEEILRGESRDIEYKVDVPAQSEKYVKTAVAFANTNGGRIVFGVENGTWKVIGFDKATIAAKVDAITNAIYDSCEPKIMPDVNVQDINGKCIIIADIVRGMQRPYCIRSQGMFNGCYVRVSATTRVAPQYQAREMWYTSQNRSYDQERVGRELSNTEINRFCKRMYQHARTLCITENERESLKRIGKSQLISYKLVVEDNGKCYATHGYQLLDGKLTEHPDAAIQCAVFKGKTRGNFITRKEITGGIAEQLEAAYTFVLEHIDCGARFPGLAREDIYELPISVIREAISNAVCHRSYLADGKIQVALFDDRLEVSSPGMLDSEMTLEKMRQGRSKIRNKGIAAVFAYMNIIEAWGGGVPKMIGECARYGLPNLELVDMGDMFRVNIYRKTPTFDQYGVINPMSNEPKVAATEPKHEPNESIPEPKITVNEPKLERDILSALSKDGTISQRKLAQILGVSVSTVKRELATLQGEGKLSRQGNHRSGTWQVVVRIHEQQQ